VPTLAPPEIHVVLEWVPIVTNAGHTYQYPTPKRLVRASDISRPVVYRWAIRREGERDVYLVGETDDLDRRLREYLCSLTAHHARIRTCFDTHIKTGAQVGLETLRFTEFTINGVTFAEGQLNDPVARRLLEALCCAVLSREGFELLNDTIVKRLAKKLEKIPPEVIAGFLKSKGYTKETLNETIRLKREPKDRKSVV
jgi:hypothetical protein